MPLQARVWINEIQFNDNSKINFDKNDITVFVGPNNSGKSASLKEAAKLLRAKNQKSIVLKSIDIEKEGDENALSSFIDLHSTKLFREGHSEAYFRGYGGYDFQIQNINQWWPNYKNGLDHLYPLFVNTLTTEERLKVANPAPNIKITTEPPNHPIHFLQKSDDVEGKFSTYFRQAFETDLVVHRCAGNEVPLYVGTRPVPETGEDRISVSYLEKIEKLDLLHLQGDGMRSFVGVLLSAFISSHSILLIDEPDAFLHPPQARLLGKMIARDLPSERQLFLTTHSGDFLKGLLDANRSNLKIIRIQRQGAFNKVSVLNSEDIDSIWSDSLLRHSNVLDGLFHSKVIICESDSDCRFYSAILFAVNEDSGSFSPDILFIHCGGKHRMPIIIKSLRKLNVDVRVIADFDVLNDTNPLKPIYEELGGTWETIANDCKILKESIDRKRPELEKDDLKTQIIEILGPCERIVPKEKVSEIEQVLRKASAWSHAKEVGKSFIPNGDPSQAYERVQTQLREKGLHVVEIGQLESFCKSVPGHGPKWVNGVLEKDLKSETELENARKFIQSVID
jgi:predicted ATPase